MTIKTSASANKVKEFKRGTKHKTTFQCACACVNRLNDDGEVSTIRIMKELRAVRDHCDYLLNEMLVEAITGVETPQKSRSKGSINGDHGRILGRR